MGIKWMIKKSVAKDLIKSVGAGNGKLEALKNEVIAILKKKENGELKKAMDFFDEVESKYTHLEKSLDGEWIEKAGLGVGTVKIWRGKKYKKVSANPSRWVRVFDKHDRGAASSMGKYIAQVKKCSSVEELYQFCMKQRSLFQDDNGVDLPIMDKLRAAIDEQKGKIEGNQIDSIYDKLQKRIKQLRNKGKSDEEIDNDKIIKQTKEDMKHVGEVKKPAEKKDIEGKSNQAENKRDKRIGGVALWDGKLKAAIKTGDADKIKSVMADIEKEYNSVKGNLKGDELDFAETEYKFRKRDADAALKNSKVLSNGKTVDEVREKYGIKVDKEESEKYVTEYKEDILKHTNHDFYSVEDAIKSLYEHKRFVDNGLYVDINGGIGNETEHKKLVIESQLKATDEIINGLKNGDKELLKKFLKESAFEEYQNRSDAMKGNKNAYKGGFEDTPIAKAVEKYASDKQIKSTVNKVSSDDFASTDPTRMPMNGTFHEDGYKIATDGRILSMIKSDYPADDEGKIKGTPKAIKEKDKHIKKLNETLRERENILDQEAKVGMGTNRYKLAQERVDEIKNEIANAEKSKESGIIDAKFPNYKKVIPSLGNTSDLETATGFEDFNKILKVAKVATAYKKNTKSNGVAVKVGDYKFNPDQLINAIAMAEKHGLKTVNFRTNSFNPALSPIEFSGDNGYIVIMPTNEDSYVFDSFTGNATSKYATEYTKDEELEKFLSGDKKSDVKKALFDLISMIDDSEEELESNFEDESYSDYDASQPELFNSTSYKVAEALDSVLDF